MLAQPDHLRVFVCYVHSTSVSLVSVALSLALASLARSLGVYVDTFAVVAVVACVVRAFIVAAAFDTCGFRKF